MRVFLALALALSPIAPASAQTALDQTMEDLTVERAAARGQEIFDHDRAAWLATDEMIADLRDPRRFHVSGWVTERTDNGIEVIFVANRDGALSRAYRGLYRDGALVEHGRTSGPLTKFQRAAYAARGAAISQRYELCAPNYNSVVLPRANPEPSGPDFDVYLMPGMTYAGVYPFGGYYRFGVDTRTRAIVDTQAFTSGCIDINANALPANVADRAIFITHIVSPTPTEIHVFVSSVSGLPVYVSAPSGLWRVSGALITRAEPPLPVLSPETM